jgi:hypothetical protein
MRTYADSNCTQTTRSSGDICTIPLEPNRSSLRRSWVQWGFESVRFWAAVPIWVVIHGVWHPGYREQ